jgi:hypothetical protein
MDHAVSKIRLIQFSNGMTKTRDIFGVPMYPLFGVVTTFLERRHHNFFGERRVQRATLFFGRVLAVKKINRDGKL